MQQPRPRQRKPKAPTLPADLWTKHKAHIVDLYVAQGKSVEEVRSIMIDQHDFSATKYQYQNKFRQWDIGKYIKEPEWKVLVRKHQLRKLIERHKNPLRFLVRGMAVQPENIEQHMNRKKHPEDELFLERPTTVTNSEIECWTFSDNDHAPSQNSLPSNLGRSPDEPEFEYSIYDTAQYTLFAGVPIAATSPDPVDFSFLSAPAEASLTQMPDSLAYEWTISLGDEIDFDSPSSPFDPPMATQDDTETTHCDHSVIGQTASKRTSQENEAFYDRNDMSTVDVQQEPAQSLPDQERLTSAEAVLQPCLDDYMNDEVPLSGKESFMASVFRLTNQLCNAQEGHDNVKLALDKSLEDEKKRLGQIPIDESELAAIYMISQLLTGSSKWLEAGDLLVSLISQAEKLLGKDGWLVVWAKADLVKVYQKLGAWAVAKQLQFEVLRSSERVFGPYDWCTFEALWQLSVIYRLQGSLRIAEKLNMRALHLSESMLGEEHISTLDMAYSLGRARGQQGRWREAEILYARVEKGYRKSFGQDNKEVRWVARELAELREAIMKRSHSMDED